GVGLIHHREQSAIAQKIQTPKLTSQFDLLTACLQQFLQPVPALVDAGSLANESCVSPARFFPALYTVAGAPPANYNALGDPHAAPRARNLFSRLLQQWSGLTGFIARVGASQRAVADLLVHQTKFEAPESALLAATQNGDVTYARVLDAVEGALTLFLD